MRIIKLQGQKRKLPNNYRKLIAEEKSVSKSLVTGVRLGHKEDYHDILPRLLQLADEFEQKLQQDEKIRPKVKPPLK